MTRKRSLLPVPSMLVVALLSVAPARADELSVVEQILTSTASFESRPTIGNDGLTDIVVFTKRDQLPSGNFDQGDIWFQRVVNGVPYGGPTQVTSAQTDDELNDVSGNHVVYTAYESTTSYSGTIMVYEISTGTFYPIGSAAAIQEPKIHGNQVVWRQGAAGSTQVMLYDLAWLSTGQDAMLIAGPVPPSVQLQIGDRFVVWAERVSEQYDVAALDLALGVTIEVTTNKLVDENNPATSGAWIVYETRAAGAPVSRIEAVNMDTRELRIVAENSAGASEPSIDGDLVAYESEIAGNRDVYLYRLSTAETFQITSDPDDQYLNDLFGNLVAYVDQRSGDEDVFLSSLTFSSTDPCLTRGGDGDGDRVCTFDDNCPTVKNPDQLDGDGDGIGDACEELDPCAEFGGDVDGDGVCGMHDNCPTVANPDQLDADGNGIGDVCEELDPCADLGGDTDGDSVCDAQDNCPTVENADQLDSDGDGTGDGCEPVLPCAALGGDSDEDGVCDDEDNCPAAVNPDQLDGDGDGTGDACESSDCPSCLSLELVASKSYHPSTNVDAEVSLCRAMSFAIPAAIPVTAGSAGHQSAVLSFHDPVSDETVACRYQGAAHYDHHRRFSGLGLQYLFESCSNEIVTGDIASADWLGLTVGNGDHHWGTTEVTLTIAEQDCDPVGPSVVTLSPEELCNAATLPEGAVELFAQTWQPPECGRKCGHEDDLPCGWIDERFAVAASAPQSAVLCLTVQTIESEHHAAPIGFVKWNGAHVFNNWDFHQAAEAAVEDAQSDNNLRVKVLLTGPHFKAAVGLRVLGATFASDVPGDPMATVVAPVLSEHSEPKGCAASPTGLSVLLVLGLLARKLRRR